MMSRRNSQQQQQHEDEQSRIFYELSSLVLNLLLRSPAPMSLSEHHQSRAGGTQQMRMTGAGLAWLLGGMSMALMVCGSVTFLLGFMLMPWVIGIVMVFYVVAVLSTISMLGRSLFSFALSPPSPPCPSPSSSPPSPRKGIIHSLSPSL